MHKKPVMKTPYQHHDPVDTFLWPVDCYRVIPRLPPVDLAFADPPFNLGVDYAEDGGASDKVSRPDYLAFTYKWVSMLAQALRPGGSMFIHVPDHIVGHISVWMENLHMTLINWIILHQEFGQYGESRFITSKVHCLYYVRSPMKLRTWNVEEVLEPSMRLRTGDPRTRTAKYKGKRPFLDVWTGNNLGRVQGNNDERRKGHANQLPELYLARLIRCASKPGDFVFDPFCGSGTMQTVARALRRNSGGCELSPKLAKSAWSRILKGPVRQVAGPLYTGPTKFTEET